MSNNDYMYAPHCDKCGIQVGAPRLVPEDYKPVRTLCFICPEGAKQEPMSDEKKFEVLTDDLCITGEVLHREERARYNGTIIPESYDVRIEARRIYGDIEGYYELRISAPTWGFGTLDEAIEKLSLIKDALLTSGARTEYQHDDYYVQDCFYYLWIDGITDEREREHHEWTKKRKEGDR
tara:strand:+ start:176 stop:712 length:537 start_codon:yes stop_codon:yes gene_type:complete